MRRLLAGYRMAAQGPESGYCQGGVSGITIGPSPRRLKSHAYRPGTDCCDGIGSPNCFQGQAGHIVLSYKSIVRVSIEHLIDPNVVACSGEVTLVGGMHVLGRRGVYSESDAQCQSALRLTITEEQLLRD